MAYDPANLPELVPLDLVVPDVIGPGLTLFVGMPHAFKSYMAVDLAYCVATGENFLGTFDCLQGHVLYAALEDGRSRIAARRQEMQIDFPPGGATFLEQDDFFKDGAELVPGIRLRYCGLMLRKSNPLWSSLIRWRGYSPRLAKACGY